MSGNAERHVVPEPIGREARQFPRKRSLLPATLITAQGSFDCRVLNLSAGGAKLECAQSVAEGESLTLSVPAIGTFSGTAIWRAEGCFGVRFDTDATKSAALGGAMLPALRPLSSEPAGSELTATDTLHAQLSGPLSELLCEIKNLRADFEQATQITSKLTTELLSRAYLLFQQAVRHNGSAITLRGEVKGLGLKPSSRSGLQHLAVDVAFPRTKVSPSLRTLYAKAIVGGHSREYTAEQFREAVETGSNGKGGINELARPLQDPSRAEPEVAPAESQEACTLPALHGDGAGERTNGGNFEAISLSENLRQRLASEDLANGAEFLVVVRVVGATELQGVEYLGPCHRASTFHGF
jgi:hypothetical protein